MVPGTAFIAGGGIAGLAAANVLGKCGWNVSVFEQGAELREIGAGIFLKQNSLRVAKWIGCLSELARGGMFLRESELLAWPSLKIFSKGVSGEGVLVLPRQVLHSVLADSARKLGVNIATNCRVVDVESSGSITFADGTRSSADIIIAADGIGSAIRAKLSLHHRSFQSGNGSWRTLLPRSSRDPQDSAIEILNGPRRMLVTACGPDQTYMFASCRMDDVSASSEFRKDIWQDSFPTFSDTIARAVEEDMIFREHSSVRVKSWSAGRVVLLGDSVHGQPPNFGQGAGLSFAHAASLAHCLSNHEDMTEAVTKWEATNRKFTLAMQYWSEKFDQVAHRWPLKSNASRAIFLRSAVSFPLVRRRWSALSAGLPEMYRRPNKADSPSQFPKLPPNRMDQCHG